MKTKIFFIILFFIILSTSVFSFSYTAIGSCSGLNDIRNDVTDTYKIMNDIDCSGSYLWNNGMGFLSIANFTGTLDGNGYAIRGLYQARVSDCGLFNSSHGLIKNLSVFAQISCTGQRAGIITAFNYGNITDVKAHGWINGSTNAMGGIAGELRSGVILRSLSNVTIIDDLATAGYCGGVVGRINSIDVGAWGIQASKSIGELWGGCNSVGGITGTNDLGYIENSYSTMFINGSTNGNAFIGGIAGLNNYWIKNSYFSGTINYGGDNTIEGIERIGGLVGENRYGVIITSFSSPTITLSVNTKNNGSLIGLNKFSVIESYALDLNIPCIGNSTFNASCYSVSPQNYFFTYDNMPIMSFSFNFYWDSSNEFTSYPSLLWESGMIYTQEKQECSFPALFCDDFQYTSDLSSKGWNVYNKNENANTTFSPKNYQAYFNGFSEPFYIYHDIETFPVSYQTSTDIIITESKYASTFSNEFDLNMSNLPKGEFQFKTFDSEYEECVILAFHAEASTIDIYFYNYTNGWVNLHSFEPNISHNIKITSAFSGTGKEALFAFNTSFPYNHPLTIYVDSAAVHWDKSLRFNPSCDNIHRAVFIMENPVYSDGRYSNATLTIDNYKMYAGTDYNIVSYYGFIPSFTEPLPEAPHTAPDGTADLADSVQAQWGSLGIISTASKIIISLIFLLVMTGAIVALCIKNQFQNVGMAVGVVDFFCMLLLVYIKLLPVWIVIAFVMLIIAIIFGGIALSKSGG